MKINYSSNSNGCGTAIALLLLFALVIFFSPWVVMMGYNSIKDVFMLPELTYWQFFWVTNAIQCLFKTNVSSN